jgi:RNA polymerase sigma factor (sigma-70 family)
VADYAATHAAIEAVWRIEAPRLIAALARITGDVGAAEELAQDTLVIALEAWSVQGVPDGPGAWLMATAKHRAIELVRRRARYEQKLQEVGRDMETRAQTSGEIDVEAMDDHIGDDLLRLIFVACHPVLSAEARAALTLRLIGGLTTHEIARAFLTAEPTIAQRIVRAKRTLAEKKIPFQIPAPGELAGRVASVLDVIYLIFNEGYAATSGRDWIRPELCAAALRLGRVLAGLMPRNIEVLGLVALMELQASRIPARTSPAGDPILLTGQDRRRWDRLLIRRGLAALERAGQLDAAPGPYAVQAEIAAGHAGALGQGHRLGTHRGAVRGARPPDPVPGRAAQPRRRRGHGLRARPRPADRRRPDQPAGDGQIRPAARRPRPPAGRAGPAGRGPRGVHRRRRADQQRTRTGHIPGTSLSLPRRPGDIMTGQNGAAPSRPQPRHGVSACQPGERPQPAAPQDSPGSRPSAPIVVRDLKGE